MKAIRTCLVCRNDGAQVEKLPSGRVADLCAKCRDNRFMVEEAERRVAAALESQ